MKSAIVLVLLALLSAQGPAPAKHDINYVVGPADILRVTVFNEPQLSGHFRIENDGTFNAPFHGRVQASGHTVAAVAPADKQGLAAGDLRDPQINVEVVEF